MRRVEVWCCLRSVGWGWGGSTRFQGEESANPADFASVPRACLAPHANPEFRDSKRITLSPRATATQSVSEELPLQCKVLWLNIYTPVWPPSHQDRDFHHPPKFPYNPLKLIPNWGPPMTTDMLTVNVDCFTAFIVHINGNTSGLFHRAQYFWDCSYISKNTEKYKKM